MSNLIVTIDGPTATGKTTVAKSVSEKLGIFHLKGGAFFRSLTLYCLSNCISETHKIVEAAHMLDLQVLESPRGGFCLSLFDECINDELWSPKVDQFVPTIAGIEEVRRIRKEWLLSVSNGRDLVADGRTLGTEIFPQATYKFYLTCDLEVRAIRRSKQPKYSGTFDDIRNDILTRDINDSNGVINRLVPPIDAIHVNCSDLTVNQTVQVILSSIPKELTNKDR